MRGSTHPGALESGADDGEALGIGEPEPTLRPRLYKIAHSAQFSARQATRRFKARGAGIPSSRRRARALQSRTARIIDRCHRPNGRILGRARKGLAYATHARAVRRDDSGCTFNSGKLKNLYACASREGNATVCICITGGGTTPHYRIDFSPELPSGEQLHGTFGAFDGTNHKPITSIEETTAGERENVPLAEHWSTRSMTINDVRSLLRQIRGFKRGRT